MKATHACAHSGPGRAQSGVALAILLWFLAAMSILVGGMVYQARMDIKLAQLQLAQAQAEAAGDGAIQLAMAELSILERDGEFSGRGIHRSRFTVGGVDVAVSITPVTGLLDLNTASEDLLAVLFAGFEGFGGEDGQALAHNVVEWRTPRGAGGMAGLDDNVGPEDGTSRGGRFQAIEDLLLVVGVNREIFEGVKDSIYVAKQGQAGVDWLSAPVSVLAALSGDVNSAEELELSRMSLSAGDTYPPAGINSSFQEQQLLPLFRVDAYVSISDVDYQRRRWVNRVQEGPGGLPWRFFRTEPVTVSNGKERKMLANTQSAHAGQ